MVYLIKSTRLFIFVLYGSFCVLKVLLTVHFNALRTGWVSKHYCVEQNSATDMSCDTLLFYMDRPSTPKWNIKKGTQHCLSNRYWKDLFSLSVIVDLNIAFLFIIIFWCPSFNFSLYWRNSKRREEATWTSPARAIRQRSNAIHHLTARYLSTIHNLAARYLSTIPTSLPGTCVLFTTSLLGIWLFTASLPGTWVTLLTARYLITAYCQCQVHELYSPPHCQVLDNSSLSGTWVLFTTSLPGTW